MGHLLCEEGGFTISDATAPRVLSLNMSVEATSIKLSFETDLVHSSSRYSGPGEVKDITMSYGEMKRLPHEIVAECMGLSFTDVRLSTIKTLMDASDRLTPDSIDIREDGSIEVIEIKTSRSNTGLRDLFEHTKAKYYEALRARVDTADLEYFIVIVCPHGVFSNKRFTNAAVDTMVSHYLFALFLQDEAKLRGWDPDQEFELEAVLQAHLKTITLDAEKLNCRGEEESLHINQEMLDSWKNLKAPSSALVFDVNCAPSFKKWKEEVMLIEEKPYKPLRLFKTRFESFLADINKITTKDSASTLIHLPIISMMKYRPYYSDWRDMEIGTLKINDRTPYGKLWSEAMYEVLVSRESYGPLLNSSSEAEIKEKGFWTSPLSSASRSKRFVVKLLLDNEQRERLALRGVQAKQLRNERFIKEKLERSRLPLSSSTSTDDIAYSFDNIKPFFKTRENAAQYPLEANIGELMKKAKQLSKDVDNPPNEKFLRQFLSTDLAMSLCFLEDVISEVNIARLRMVRKDHFVVKRLPSFQAYVMIKPTTTDKQIFFSVLVPKAEVHAFFPLTEEWLDLGGCYCTEFVSLDRHKLTHLLYTPYKAASLLAFWEHQFGIPISRLFPVDERVMNHFWLSLLVFLEDKEKTSTSLQLIRYAYMEVIKGGVTVPDPGKILKKLDTKIRSRLLLFCIGRFVEAFSQMVEDLPKISKIMRSKDSLASDDEMGRLVSWVDLKPIKNFEVALNLSYLGVLHNKEEGDLVHGYLKIFDKIIDQEEKLYSSNMDKMIKSESLLAEEFGDHEFSAAAVKSFAITTKDYLTRKHGSYDSWVSSALSNALLRRTFQELSTSKASAPFFPESAPDDGDLMEEEMAFNDVINKWRNGNLGEPPKQSTKCVENVYQLLKELDADSDKVFTYFGRILSSLEAQGGICVKLFKKLQIGGTREIFILPIKARIVINFLETICRRICEDLPCEMLTKGDQKVSRSDLHFKRKNQVCSNHKTVTIINSDDAATWAQRFVMPVFGVMLSVLVPDPFLKPCLRVLNLVTSKRLTLPTELLRLFQVYKTVPTENPSIALLKREYLRHELEGNRMLLECGSNLMKNRSNMMQGILHYTSSLLHSCFMTSYCYYLDFKVKKRHASSYIKAGVFTGKVSSDDSSMLMTVALDLDAPPKATNIAMTTLSFYGYLKGACYPLFCSKQSYEKSTSGCSNMIEEFNSLWYFRNTLLSPSLKFVSASVRTHVTDRFELRQNVMAGLRSQVLENSGSIFLTSVVMSCQARAHYEALGALSHPLWPFYKRQILSNPHPCYGFFLTDHHLASGLLGHQFNMFMACKNTEVSRITKKFLGNCLLNMDNQDLGTTSITISQGTKTRFSSMLSRMGVNLEGELDYFDANPQSLFEPPTTAEDLLHLIALKASTPSMANAFEFLTDSKQHAASSYLLQSPCVSLTTRKVFSVPWVEGRETEVKKEKLSLCGLIEKTGLGASLPSPLFLDEQKMLFPNFDLFQEIADFLEKTKKMSLVYTTRERRIYVTVTMQKFSVSFLATPYDAARAKWFGKTTKFSNYEVEQTWTVMSGLIPWIKPSFADTLSNSPLGSAVAICQFLRSLPQSTTSVRILAPCYRKTTVADSFREMICKTQWPGTQIVLDVSSLSSSSSSSSQGPGYIHRPKHDLEELSILESAIEDLPSSKKSAKDICHSIERLLWFEASLPPESREAVPGFQASENMRIRAIFEQSVLIMPTQQLNDPTCFSQLTPREATLAIFQAVIKSGVQDVSIPLKCAKRGLVGEYTVRATYDETKDMYVGPATWAGTYNGVPFELHSHNERVVRLTLKTRESFSKLCKGFITVIRDLRCNLDTRPDDCTMNFKDKKAQYKGEFVDFRTCSIYPNFGPGRVALEIHPPLSPRDCGVRVNLTIQDGILRLIEFKDPRGRRGSGNKPRRYHTVLSYKPRTPAQQTSAEWSLTPPVLKVPLKAPHAFGNYADPSSQGETITRNPYDIWVAGKKMSLDTARKVIRSSLMTTPGTIGDVFPEMKEWLKKTLLARAEVSCDIRPACLTIGSLLKGSELSDDLNPLEAEENLADIDMADFFTLDDSSEETTDEMFSGFSAIVEGLFDESQVPEDNAWEPGMDWSEYEPVDPGLLEELSVSRPPLLADSMRDAPRAHPFWDKFLESIKHNTSHQTRNLAVKGIYYENSAPDVKLLAELFGATMPNKEPSTLGADDSSEY